MVIAATANIRETLPHKVAELALDKVLTAANPHIIGVQEWGTSRNPAMKRLAHKHGMQWTRVSGAGPIMWADHLRLVKARPVTLARASRMGWLPGRRTHLPASVAALAILTNEYGHETSVLNVHLTAEVQYGTGYRTDRAHRPRVRRHKREVKAIARIARNQRRKGREVYVVGDTNFDGLRIPGLISCWQGRLDVGTLGSRAVDVVFATSPANRVRTIATPSDHDAVAATY